MSQPSPATVPTATPQVVRDPYGSPDTFSWGSGDQTYIPKPGDADYSAYQTSLGNWLRAKEIAYKESPKYLQDQAASNPAIASGQVPAVGFTATTPNAWGIPVGSTVTSLNQQQDGGYQIGYTQPSSFQQVKINGPGYGFEGYVKAPDAQSAGQIALANYRNQTAGVDTSPNKIGGYVSSMGVGRETVVQVGNPDQNAYWVDKGLPQYAAYTKPSLQSTEQEQGFYIKDVSANGVAPKVTVGNSQYESFWTAQGHPELGNYQAPALQSGQYIYNPTVDASGQLTYGVGNKDWEKQWASLGVTDVNAIRGYAPPENLPQGSYVKDVTHSSEGLKFQVGNTVTEAKLIEINSQLATVNRENQTFTDAYNLGVSSPSLIGKGAISLTDYQKAMAKQNQKTVNVLNEAESYGFIDTSAKQTSLAQLNANLQNINALALTVPSSSPQPQSQSVVKSATKVYSAFNPAVSPLGVDPSSDITRVAQTDVSNKTLLVRSDYKLANVKTVSLGNQQQTTYTLVPKNQPLQQNLLSNDVFTGKNLNFAGIQPLVNTNEKRLVALEVVSAVITAPATVALQGAKSTTEGLITIGKNVGAGVVASQGIKTTLYGLEGKDITQSVLSPTEVLEAGAGSIVLSGAVGKASQVLNIAGKGIEPAIERTALYGSIGAGSGAVGEYAQTGKVTLEGPTVGGVTALGIGALSEAGSVFVRGKGSFTEPINGGYSGKKVMTEIKTEPVMSEGRGIAPELKTSNIPVSTKAQVDNSFINSKRGEFITGVSGDNRSQPNGMPDYLIKQPDLKNLEIAKTYHRPDCIYREKTLGEFTITSVHIQ